LLNVSQAYFSIKMLYIFGISNASLANLCSFFFAEQIVVKTNSTSLLTLSMLWTKYGGKKRVCREQHKTWDKNAVD